MLHSSATVATKRAVAPKSRSARPLSNPDIIAFSFMDALMSADDAIAAKRAAIQSAIDEYNAMVRFRRNLRDLSETVAA